MSRRAEEPTTLDAAGGNTLNSPALGKKDGVEAVGSNCDEDCDKNGGLRGKPLPWPSMANAVGGGADPMAKLVGGAGAAAAGSDGRECEG
jgi:hypothetical protein